MAAIELYEAMRTLRAVRRLRPDPIPDDVLRRVLEAATWAPTGGNRQAWRIIVVKDQMRKQRLGELYKKITIPFMQSYSERLVSLPESERAKTEKMLRSGVYLAEHFGEAPVLCIFCFNPDGLAVTDADLPRVSVVGGVRYTQPCRICCWLVVLKGLGACSQHFCARRNPRLETC